MHNPQAQPKVEASAHAPQGAPAPDERNDEIRAITREVDRIAKIVERMNLGDYVGLLQKPGRLLWLNFIAGMARGLGTILGATVLVSLIVAIAQRIIASHLPGVGNFFAEFLELLREQGNGH